MILIVTETQDKSADNVCKWLQYFGKNFLRINSDLGILLKLKCSFFAGTNGATFTYGDTEFSISDFKTVWFRRGRFKLWQLDQEYNTNAIMNSYIHKHIKNEIETVYSFLYNNLPESALVINNPISYNANKLSSFVIATEVGFKIPRTIISSEKNDVLSFFSDDEKILVKYIQDSLSIRDYKNKIFESSPLRLFSKNEINEMPNSFFYTCFQNFLDKKYEVRVFIFLDLIFSVAILSQSYVESKIDGRNLTPTTERTVRIVPYKLDEKIKQMCVLFMSKSNYNSGSIDLVVTNSDEVFFLEVNPVGQFDYVSKRGNFFLEKEIAKRL